MPASSLPKILLRAYPFLRDRAVAFPAYQCQLSTNRPCVVVVRHAFSLWLVVPWLARTLHLAGSLQWPFCDYYLRRMGKVAPQYTLVQIL